MDIFQITTDLQSKEKVSDRLTGGRAGRSRGAWRGQEQGCARTSRACKDRGRACKDGQGVQGQEWVCKDRGRVCKATDITGKH